MKTQQRWDPLFIGSWLVAKGEIAPSAIQLLQSQSFFPALSPVTIVFIIPQKSVLFY